MKVAVLESYSVGSLARLQAAGCFTLTENLQEAEAALIRSRVRIDKEFLDRSPHLKVVITATSGFDHIDWRECQKRGIIAAHSPNANAGSTAELTLGLLIASERRLLEAYRNVRDNRWREGLKRPHGLEGRTLGIVGLGRVGARVARMAQTFGMQLIGHDPYVELDQFENLGVERIGFTELLRASDFVTLHVPLTRETKHLLNLPTFKEMQSDAFLLNLCRGPVVDQNDLMTALDERLIRGAAMDVIEREPPPAGHRLLTHPKLLLTPHIGAFTESAWEKASQEAVTKLIHFQAGDPIQDTLPLNTPWFSQT